jgi:hypothetical protein
MKKKMKRKKKTKVGQALIAGMKEAIRHERSRKRKRKPTKKGIAGADRYHTLNGKMHTLQ